MLPGIHYCHRLLAMEESFLMWDAQEAQEGSQVVVMITGTYIAGLGKIYFIVRIPPTYITTQSGSAGKS